MKKIVLLFLIILSFNTCGQKYFIKVDNEGFIIEGWVDQNTFRVTAAGVPNASLADKIPYRSTAREAALLMAQKRIIEKFVSARIKSESAVADYASTGLAVAKEFKADLRGGTIVKKTYDDDNNCEIVYQVKKKGLKQQVMDKAKIK